MNQLTTSDEPAEVAEFVDVMIDELHLVDAIRSPEVEAALRRVPRWRFAPGIPLAQVYDPEVAVITKRDAHGVAISSISAPRIQAFMLEQASIAPGMRVLEIGSGGFNAALIAELVGADGHVTTMDVDAEVTAKASEFLRAAGYDRVEVVCGDAYVDLPGDGIWDRIIVTVGAWDIPPVWTDRLAEDGRIIVPLRMRGITRSLALEPLGDSGLTTMSAEVCGFVQMQGDGCHEEDLWMLRGPEIGLRFDDLNAPDMTGLDGVLSTQRRVLWTGVLIKAQVPFDSLELLAAARLPHSCLLAVAGTAGQGLLTHNDERRFRVAHVHDKAFAYLVTRPLSDGQFEFGAAAFGAADAADQAAALLAYQIRDWDARRSASADDPDITIWPASTPVDNMPAGVVLDKQHRRIVLSWPSSTKPSA